MLVITVNWKLVAGLLAVLALLLVNAVYMEWRRPRPEASQRDNRPTVITLEEYSRLHNGMTYEEVVDVVGEEGTPVPVTEKDAAAGLTAFAWNNPGQFGGHAVITFKDGVITDRLQLGLAP